MDRDNCLQVSLIVFIGLIVVGGIGFIFSMPIIVVADWSNKSGWTATECGQCTNFTSSTSGAYYVGYMNCQYYPGGNVSRTATLQYPYLVPWLEGKTANDVATWASSLTDKNTTCYIQNLAVNNTEGYNVKLAMWGCQLLPIFLQKDIFL